MPQVIQRPPAGLLSILDSKAGGRNPNELNDTVGVVLDALPLYEVLGRLSRNSTIAAGAIVLGFNDFAPTLLQPPAGEIWHVLGGSARMAAAAGAGADYKFQLGIRDTRNSGFLPIGERLQALPNDQCLVGAQCDYWMTANEIACLWVSDIVGATDTVGTLFFNRFSF